jgi:hypothetical protein
MNNIKKAAKYVSENADSSEAQSLIELAIALETGDQYALTKLYELNHAEFKLAMGMIDDWRLDRHYLSKLRLLDHAELPSASPLAPIGQ